MKSIELIASVMLLTFIGPAVTLGQRESTFRIVEIAPYDKAVPGLILELRVEGLGGAPDLTFPPEDFQIEVTQDGIKQQMNARVVLPMMTRETNVDGSFGEMKSLQSVAFVVPQGLHPGEADIALSYRNKQSNTIKLIIVDRPLRPLVASLLSMATGPTDSSAPSKPGTSFSDLGWRLERASKVELLVAPLTDPEDHNSAVLIRFKQGDTYFDGNARVVHRPRKTEVMDRGVAFLPERDVLEVEITAALAMGPAEMEIRLRANGQTSDPASLKVQITDSTRAVEAPAVNAPRLLSVTPQRIGAGQTLMLTVDYLRTLAPDPSQTMILIEQGSTRYIVKPDFNSAEHMPDAGPDAPVLLMARPTRQIIGTAQIHVFNSLRGEQGGLSAAKSIEIVDEVLPPEIISVDEATDDELGPLRQMYEIQHKAGRPFQEYDPSYRYLTIRGSGLDFNPRLVRITLEQNRRRTTLTPADFSFQGENILIVRVPNGIAVGPVVISIENRSAESSSAPVIRTFVLTKTR